MQIKLTKIFALALILGFAGGCADMVAVEKAQSTANAALAEAQAASSAANNAFTIASEASYAASQAQADATAALECCNDNAARLDRMFEKAMVK